MTCNNKIKRAQRCVRSETTDGAVRWHHGHTSLELEIGEARHDNGVNTRV